VMAAIGNEVVAPDVAAMGRSKPDARSVIQPEPSSLWVPVRYFQPFATPNPLDPLGIHRPSFLSKQCGDAAVSIATVDRGQSDNIRRQALLVGAGPQTPALG